MPRCFAAKMPRTYATPENAVKAVEKTRFAKFDYVIAVDGEGRYFPCFVDPKAMHEGVHFTFAIVWRPA